MGKEHDNRELNNRTGPRVPTKWLAAGDCGAKLFPPAFAAPPADIRQRAYHLLLFQVDGATCDSIPIFSCCRPLPTAHCQHRQSPAQLGHRRTISTALLPVPYLPKIPPTPTGIMPNGAAANGPSSKTHTPSQRYLSTRGDDSGVSYPSSPLHYCLARRRAADHVYNHSSRSRRWS